MEELLILLSFILGLWSLGYVVAHVVPIEELREALGRARPRAVALREALRAVLQAPASASELDLIAEVAQLRQLVQESEEVDAPARGAGSGEPSP